MIFTILKLSMNLLPKDLKGDGTCLAMQFHLTALSLLFLNCMHNVISDLRALKGGTRGSGYMFTYS